MQSTFFLHLNVEFDREIIEQLISHANEYVQNAEAQPYAHNSTHSAQEIHRIVGQRLMEHHIVRHTHWVISHSVVRVVCHDPRIVFSKFSSHF